MAIEKGSRKVYVGELLLLAAALDAAPLDLHVPDDGEPVELTPGWSLDRRAALAWIAGVGGVAPGGDLLTVQANRPASERERLRAQYQEAAAETNAAHPPRPDGQPVAVGGDPDYVPEAAKAKRYQPGWADRRRSTS